MKQTPLRTPKKVKGPEPGKNVSPNYLAEITKTSYDKVIDYLKDIKTFIIELDTSNTSQELKTSKISKITWIIETIQNQSLYQYNPESLDNCQDKERDELDSIMGFLDKYSTNNKRKNMRFQTLSKQVIKKEDISPLEVQQFYSFNREQDQGSFSPEVKLNKVFDFNNEPSNRRAKNESNQIGATNLADFQEESEIFDSFNNVPINIIPNLPKASLRFENKFKEVENEILHKNFNIFEFENEIGSINLMPHIFQFDLTYADRLIYRYDISTGTINSLIDYSNLNSFAISVREKYQKNPYHNQMHGIDVFHTIFHVFHYSNICEVAALSNLDILSVLLSGLIHDIGHPGFNNNFLVNSKSDLALIYNDHHVLENYHCSEGYKLFLKSSTNILCGLDSNQIKLFRKRFILMILSTDPANHSKIMSLMKNKILINEINEGINAEKLVSTGNRKFEDQQEILDFLISFADTSHSCKPFEVTFKWSTLLMEEFWHQGDVEKGLGIPVSFLCDRNDAFVGKGQIGFMQAIIKPGVVILNSISPSLHYLLVHFEENIVRWENFLKNKDK